MRKQTALIFLLLILPTLACQKKASHQEAQLLETHKNTGEATTAEEATPTALTAATGAGPKLDTALLGEHRETTLAVMQMPFSQTAKLLGSMQLSAKAHLQTSGANVADKIIDEDFTLLLDEKGHYAISKNTSSQYGQEVRWVGGFLYPRLRHSKFIKRRPRPGEAAEIANRLSNHLAAYTRLLGRFMEVQRGAEEQLQGRTAIVVKLHLSDNPEPPVEDDVLAHRWRASIKVSRLEGKVWFEKSSGAVMQAELSASWNFHPPAAEEAVKAESGIPTKIDEKTEMTTQLKFSSRLDALGKVETVTVPAADQIVDQVQRLRLEIERQVILGEVPFPEGGTRLGQ